MASILFMLAALLLSSLTPAPTLSLPLAARPGAGVSSADRKTIQSIEEYLERCEFFGWSGAVLIEEKGRIVFHRGFGEADREKKTPWGEDTVFEIASATKPFTACAILALVDEGKVDLDGSIAEYLPGVPDARKNITVRHLLSHTSGMGRMQGTVTGTDLETAVKGAFSEQPYREPGAEYDYWNQGYALLAGIIENVTDEGYLDYMRKRLFAKAGLKVTGFTGDGAWPLETQAIGYVEDAPVRHAAEHPYGVYDYRYRGMGGIVTTAEELWKLGHAALDGKLLKKSTTAEMLKSGAGSHALGWRSMETNRKTLQIGHGGDVAGFHTSMNFLPDEDAAVIVISSVDEVDSRQIAWNIEQRLLAKSPAVWGPPEIAPVKARLLAGCEGTYGDGAGVTVTVRRVGPGLELAGADLGGKSLLMGSTNSKAVRELGRSAQELMDLVRGGDPEPLRERIAEGIPRRWADDLVHRYYPERVKGLGAFVGHTPLSCGGAGTASTECVLQLQYESGVIHVKIRCTDGKLDSLDLKAQVPGRRHRFARTISTSGGGKSGANKSNDGDDEPFHTHLWSPFRATEPTIAISFESSLKNPETLVIDVPGVGEFQLKKEDA